MADISFSTPHVVDRSNGGGAKPPADWLVCDAPADLDEALSTVKVLPRWVCALVLLALAGGLWCLIVAGCAALLAHG